MNTSAINYQTSAKRGVSLSVSRGCIALFQKSKCNQKSSEKSLDEDVASPPHHTPLQTGTSLSSPSSEQCVQMQFHPGFRYAGGKWEVKITL